MRVSMRALLWIAASLVTAFAGCTLDTEGTLDTSIPSKDAGMGGTGATGGAGGTCTGSTAWKCKLK